jgi:hypothetical protein
VVHFSMRAHFRIGSFFNVRRQLEWTPFLGH